MTIRLDMDLAEQVGLIARARGMSVAAFIREAIRAALMEQAHDPVLRARLADEMQRIERILGADADHGAQSGV